MITVSDNKTQRLEQIARLYYEQNKTQKEIAAVFGISRPLVSRLLAEARNVGIVDIRIHPANQKTNLLLERVKEQFGLKDGILLPHNGGDHALNRNLAFETINFLNKKGSKHIGISWGHIIGTLVEIIEDGTADSTFITDVCPLIGNSGAAIRNYHSNENVRIIAQHSAATPHYLYTPAFVETEQDLDLLKQTDHYKSVFRQWERMEAVLVNISNHPSTPDLASVARYGDLLVKHKAVGRLIAYHYNENGEIISSDTDYVIQIPVNLLKKSKNVIGCCSANVNWRSLLGALRTGLFTDVVATEKHISEILKSL